MRTSLRWLLILLLAISGGSLTFAQSTNAGDIRGTVTDTTGAVVPGVKVTVLNVETGVSKDFTTNQDGVYDTSSIVTGKYIVKFVREGFESYTRGPITLQVGFTTVNAQLKVGSQTVQVVVNTDVPLLQTETGDQSTTLDSKSMTELPQVTQDWQNFMILLPGASGTVNGSQGASNPGQEVSVNGNLPYSNVMADGASTTLSHSQNSNTAIFETVSELQVNTSAFSAQYGVGGIIFNQISKGGTSQFHGSAYDYLQNDALTAHSYFQYGSIPFLRYHNFGGTIGGPVLKKKMFFFFAYDQILSHGNSSGTNSVPTEAIMSGDFSGIQTLYDPTTQTIAYDTAGNPYPVRKSFAEEYGSGNVIPSSLIDSVSAQFQKWYPTSSSHLSGGQFLTGTTGSEGELQNNFYASVPEPDPHRKYFGRLDYDITPKNRLTLSDTQADEPAHYPSTVTVCPVGCQSGDVDNNNAQITDVWNISDRVINEARIGYTWQGNFFADLSLGKNYPAQLGWQFAKANTLPAIDFSGTYPYAWINPSSNSVYKEHVFDPSDVVTMIVGKHLLHFGGELLFYRDNSTAWGNTNAGALYFSGDYTKQWALNADGVAEPVSGTGMEYADFLLGYSNSWNASVTPEYGARLKSPQMFVQDDWKVRPNLTVNLGLRYQINHGWNEVKNNIDNFDPTVTNPATGTLGAFWFASTGANGRKALEANVFSTWLPRVGFSWLLDPKTTVRGGFGLYSYNWSLDTYGSGMGNPFGKSGSVSDTTNGIYAVTKLDGTGTRCATTGDGVCPASTTDLPYTSASTAADRFNGQNVWYQQYHTPVPKIYQWTVAVQRELGPDYAAELSYVASHGFNLVFSTDLNQVPESKLTSNDSADRPYPVYGNITGSTNNGISNYNSLQASITKRMSHGVSFNFSYVWSHMLDDMDSSGWGSRAGEQPYQIANSPSANYSNSNFDVRNSFKGYAVYALPFGKGQMFLNKNALVDAVIGGWQLAGTVVLSSGNPFTVYSSQDTYALAGSSFPNWNPGVSTKPTNRSIHNWYNPAAFTQPANGTFGNVRRNSLYGPGLNYQNLSGSKTFSLPWENIKLQIRCDAQNVFNHPSFGNPSTSLGSSDGSTVTAGTAFSNATTITSTTVSGRNVQLGAHLTF
ncbi:MAG: TonB-dependent receptor [Terracidiphilus sp.]|nr:TonB-dependent receptor [Terracidiphilus sp.]